MKTTQSEFRDDKQLTQFKHSRPTVGVLLNWQIQAGETPDRYVRAIHTGIVAEARARQVNLLHAWGMGRVTEPHLRHPAWPEFSPDSDFVPISTGNTDGLIVFAPLSDPGRSELIQRIAAEGFPVFFIASGEGEPMVSVDNQSGIRQAVTHLLEHGHRRIAFLAGDPQDQGDGKTRLNAYLQAVQDFALEQDPGLVKWGYHSRPGGAQAVQDWLATGTRFSALIASNDNSAIGAMAAIRAAGLKIPRDIAVIGFDDQPDAIAQIPALTSVHTPLEEMGRRALAILADHLILGQKMESVQVSTSLALRQSCGCIPPIVAASGFRIRSTPQAGMDALPYPQLRDSIAAEMAQEVRRIAPGQPDIAGTLLQQQCAGLVDAFFTSLNEHKPSIFWDALVSLINQFEQDCQPVAPWQRALSVLRFRMTQLPGAWEDTRLSQFAEDILHASRAAVAESLERQDYRHQLNELRNSQVTGVVTARLRAFLDLELAIADLETHLDFVGIRHVRIALFQPQGDDPTAYSRILNPQFLNREFATREFPPPWLYPADELLNLAVVPLTFQGEILGFAAFDGENLSPIHAIAQQIIGTIITSRLHREVTELSLKDPLTQVSNRRYFNLFLENELDRCQRYQRALALVLLDIDHLKMFNDTYGHLLGDQVLQIVGACLKIERRSTDLVARFGGDEFALILPETNLEDALSVAHKIQAAVAQASPVQQAITLSIGVSVTTGEQLSKEKLIDQADSALYEAKHSGRNQICIFSKK